MNDPRAGRLAVLLAVGFGVGSLGYAAVGLTVGVVTGLLVLMVPLWPLGAQAFLVAESVLVGQWWGAPRVGRTVAFGFALVPPAAALFAYLRAHARCGADDACHAYLDDHHLLPGFLGVCAVCGIAEAAVLGLFVLEARRSRA